MKSYNKLIISVLFLLVVLCVAVNIWINLNDNKDQNREYQVEIMRLVSKMSDMEEAASVDISWCKYVKKIIRVEDESALIDNSPFDYCIKNVNGDLYRFEYEGSDIKKIKRDAIICVNIIFVLAAGVIITVLLYIRSRIILPFHELEEIPYELSKGNLVVDMEEHETKYFGRFIWGINMLRESLQDRRQKELDMHKDNKVLLLSLTHDIKTPLSVIKLNAQALQKGLYKDKEKQKEVASSICERVDEIEKYVSEITAASQDDFLDLTVKEEEFYLSSVIEHIREYNKPKLELNKTEFYIEPYKDCLLSGDEERLKEVIQNIMENAIKYGDGKRISITVAREENCTLITVSNSGVTLNRDELPKIFDSFYRGTNVGDKQGSGLGLYICRKLMNNMNGSLFAKESDDMFMVTVVVRMS